MRFPASHTGRPPRRGVVLYAVLVVIVLLFHLYDRILRGAVVDTGD